MIAVVQDYTGLLTVIVSIVGGGGLLGGIYALLKLRPEAGQISVSAAQGAVIVQTGVIDTLRDEIIRLKEENTVQASIINTLRARVASLERRTAFIEEENGLEEG